MPAIESEELRVSETNASLRSRFLIYAFEVMDAFGAGLPVSQILTKMKPPVSLSNVLWHFTSSSFQKTKAGQSRQMIFRLALSTLESGAVQRIDRIELTSHNRLSVISISSGSVQSLMGYKQTNAPGSMAGQVGFGPVKGLEVQYSESPKYGETDRSKGNETMGASSETGVDATLKHHHETLERVEGKINDIEKNQRSDFRWLLGIMISGFLAIIVAIIGAPRLLPPASIVPQYSPGGYTLTVNPDPAQSASSK